MWPDNWTVTTMDGQRSAQFEHTILVTDTGSEILTARNANSVPLFWESDAQQPAAPVPFAAASAEQSDSKTSSKKSKKKKSATDSTAAVASSASSTALTSDTAAAASSKQDATTDATLIH